MRAYAAALTLAVPAANPEPAPFDADAMHATDIGALTARVAGEFYEMPGLRLSVGQAARLFGVEAPVAEAVLEELRRASVLTMSNGGMYLLIRGAAGPGQRVDLTGRTARMRNGRTGERIPAPPLADASIERLTCLLRHWTWADEARRRFEQELAAGWNYDEDTMADHPFGSYYHWCALLCGFSEAALDDGLLSTSQMEPIRSDLYASLPGLRACRQLLIVIPSSLEEQPLVVDLIADEVTLGRLRRIHDAFGRALRDERAAREIESLDH
jgi:hypothetical protein